MVAILCQFGLRRRPRRGLNQVHVLAFVAARHIIRSTTVSASWHWHWHWHYREKVWVRCVVSSTRGVPVTWVHDASTCRRSNIIREQGEEQDPLNGELSLQCKWPPDQAGRSKNRAEWHSIRIFYSLKSRCTMCSWWRYMRARCIWAM